MPEQRKIRVLIADDFNIMRDVIHLILEDAGDVAVVGEAPDLEDVLASVASLRPDVIIMNDYLPPIDSAKASQRFRAHAITAAILIISMHADPDLIRRSLASGANGFLHKDEMGDHLVDAVRQVHRGRQYLSPKAEQALSGRQD